MTEIILHIGTPKTGTTAIQDALAANDSVLSDANIAFLKAGRQRSAHNDLANAISRHGADNKFQQDFDAEFAAASGQNVLISSEIFTLVQPQKVAQALPMLGRHPLKIVAYLRRQDQYAEAFYKQRIKNGRIKIPFADFLISRNGQKIMDYPRLLSKWARTFPDAEICPRIYDRARFPNGDIVADFASLLGLAPDALSAQVGERNLSPGKDFIDILLAIAPEFDGPELRAIFRNVKAQQIDGFSGSADLFTDAERTALLAGFTDDDAQLRDLYFPESSVVFPPFTAGAKKGGTGPEQGLSPQQFALLSAAIKAALEQVSKRPQ